MFAAWYRSRSVYLIVDIVSMFPAVLISSLIILSVSPLVVPNHLALTFTLVFVVNVVGSKHLRRHLRIISNVRLFADAHSVPVSIDVQEHVMQEARCPECGEGIGGQSHQLVEGVTRAAEMEE